MAARPLFTNKKSFLKGCRAVVPRVKQKFMRLTHRVAFFIHEEVTSRTPVYTGETVANYQWSIGNPKTGTVEAVERPSYTGRTNMNGMGPLGPELRRPANTRVANATLRNVPWRETFGKQIYFVNNDETFGGLEYGLLPDEPVNKLRPRSTNGMVRITLQAVSDRWRAGYFLRDI